MSLLQRINTLFPLWAICFAAVACLVPDFFTQPLTIGHFSASWLPGLPQLITPLLMVIMFCMGLTLTAADFARVAREPHKVLLGVALQFLLMPLAAWLVAQALGLAPELMVGMVVVGAAAGGTASNVITYLAGGRVALSITMTLVSTLVSVLATPLLTGFYAGQTLNVPVQAMMQSIAQIVVVPVVFGVLANRLLKEWLPGREDWLAFVAMACIVIVIATIVALNRDQLFVTGPLVALAVILHNLLGLSCGYAGARLLGCDSRDARTIAIEVGMQNSGLAVVLAAKYFGPAAALPGAIFSIWHNISGSLLAGYWARRKPDC